LFTAVNMDTSIIHEMVSATERAISCHLEKEKGRGRGKERGRGKGVVWVRLRVALPFGDSEAVEVLRTTTAAPDTHSELCLDLLLSTLCADVAAHLLDEEREEEEKEKEEEEEDREEPLLVDGDSLFARTVCAALLLSFIAFVRDSSLEVEGEEEQQQEEEEEEEGDW
jgi:hypothetical protein